MRGTLLTAVLAALLLVPAHGIAPGAEDATAVAEAVRAEADAFKDGLAASLTPHTGELGAAVLDLANTLEVAATAGAGTFVGIGQLLAGAAVEAVQVERRQAEACLGLANGPDPAKQPDLQCLQRL